MAGRRCAPAVLQNGDPESPTPANIVAFAEKHDPAEHGAYAGALWQEEHDGYVRVFLSPGLLFFELLKTLL